MEMCFLFLLFLLKVILIYNVGDVLIFVSFFSLVLFIFIMYLGFYFFFMGYVIVLGN